MSTKDIDAKHDAAPLVGVGSSEGLGPLPKPDGWAVGESYYPDSTTHMGGIRFGADAERYTADQVRALLAAERERWAERVEEAFREGYWGRETYNDCEVSDANESWAHAKAWLLRA